MSLDTQQNRRDIERLVRNVFPGCVPIFLDEDKSLAFQVEDTHGRLRSGVVKVRDWHNQRFTKSWLRRQIKLASTDEPGFPRLPTT